LLGDPEPNGGRRYRRSISIEYGSIKNCEGMGKYDPIIIPEEKIQIIYKDYLCHQYVLLYW